MRLHTFENFIKENKEEGVITYHGGEYITNDTVRVPLYTTTDLWAVEDFYLGRGGYLTTCRVNLKNPLQIENKDDVERDWLPILDELGVDYEYKDDEYGWKFESKDIPSNGLNDNINDVIHIPGFVEKAIEKGYDGINTWDTFFQGSIRIYVPFKKESIEVISSKKVRGKNGEKLEEI